MTIKATFLDVPTMLFGDSYRKSWDQLAEYCRIFKKPRPFVEISSSQWIGFGGVKWCSLASLQEELDEEGDGRKAESFVFRPLNLIEQRTLAKYVRAGENVQAHTRAGDESSDETTDTQLTKPRFTMQSIVAIRNSQCR